MNPTLPAAFRPSMQLQLQIQMIFSLPHRPGASCTPPPPGSDPSPPSTAPGPDLRPGASRSAARPASRRRRTPRGAPFRPGAPPAGGGVAPAWGAISPSMVPMSYQSKARVRRPSSSRGRSTSATSVSPKTSKSSSLFLMTTAPRYPESRNTSMYECSTRPREDATQTVDAGPSAGFVAVRTGVKGRLARASSCAPDASVRWSRRRSLAYCSMSSSEGYSGAISSAG